MNVPHPRTATRGLVVIAAVLLTLGLAAPVGAADEEGELVLDERLIEEVLELIADRYVDEEALDRDALTEGAIRGIIDALGDDGHTLYLTPEELQVEQDALAGRVVGIGVVVDQRAGSTQIISVIDGSPADEAGLRAGDIIVSVDDTNTSRIGVDELGELVRGELGTRVQLGIERPGSTQRLDFSVVRDDVEIEPVAWAFAPGSDVAVVRIVQFSSQAGRETRSAVRAALEGGASGIVLDLRGNPGGLVDEAIIVASSFVRQGVAYVEQGREGPPRNVALNGSWTIAPDIPVVVLVDYGTASSAEIVAAALRDNDRARIVGEPTFGTGTILNTFDLSDGSAIRLGVVDWLTPEGEAVFRVGLAPDEVVRLPLGAVALEPADLEGMSAIEFTEGDDAPLRHAVRLLEASLVR